MHQSSWADAQHGAAAGHVVELDGAVGEDERVVIWQRHHAGAKANVLRTLGGGGDEHFRRTDDFEASGMMFANPGLMIVQLVEMLQQLHVALQRERGIFAESMKRSQENAAAQVAHWVGPYADWSQAITPPGGTSRRHARCVRRWRRRSGCR